MHTHCISYLSTKALTQEMPELQITASLEDRLGKNYIGSPSSGIPPLGATTAHCQWQSIGAQELPRYHFTLV